MSAETRASLIDWLKLFLVEEELRDQSMADALDLARQRWGQRKQETSAELLRLEQLAKQDSLTGCLNRDAFFRAVDAAWEQGLTTGNDICCVMADVDQFKRVNDVSGHAVGDNVLRKLAKLLARPIVGKYGGDEPPMVGRYGGDEFCRLLAPAQCDQAAAWALQVRAEAERTLEGNATVSLGVACLAPSHHLESATLVELADQSLYEAKAAGRNCVRVAAGPNQCE